MAFLANDRTLSVNQRSVVYFANFRRDHIQEQKEHSQKNCRNDTPEEELQRSTQDNPVSDQSSLQQFLEVLSFSGVRPIGGSRGQRQNCGLMSLRLVSPKNQETTMEIPHYHSPAAWHHQRVGHSQLTQKDLVILRNGFVFRQLMQSVQGRNKPV